MLFKRKPKNRRIERDHVLDVKLSSNQVRSARMRRTGAALSVLFGAAFVLFVAWRGGQWLLDRFIYENEAFAITQITVETEGVIHLDSIREFSMVKSGQNLLALDLARVKEHLERVPWIRSAAVERVLPHTLKLRVTEREAVAQVRLPGVAENSREKVFHIDDSGFVMSPIPERVRALPGPGAADNLPRISGIPVTELLVGRTIESQQLRAALEFLGEFDHSSMAGVVDVETVDISAPEILRVLTTQQNEIFFGTSQFNPQLRHWRIVHDFCQRNGKGISTLDLSVSNNAPLRYVDASALPVVAPKSVKPQRPRKKNV